MIELLQAAKEVARVIEPLGLPYCIIGGLALQARGELRFTTDVDLTLLTGFKREEAIIESFLRSFGSRIPNAREHALRYRVLLLETSTGIGVDIGLGGFPFEEDMVRRSELLELAPGYVFPVISAEDLVTMKTFAGRGQDWHDIRGILIRQGRGLNWEVIESALLPLLEIIEAGERWTALLNLREELEAPS